jgi:hypothetical protein
VNLPLLDDPPPALPEPDRDCVARVASIIDRLLTCPATEAVGDFYNAEEGFAADTFLGLMPNDPWVLSAADLLAATLLDVRFGPSAVRALLPGGELATVVSHLLARLPIGVPLWEATERDLAWANALWHVVRDNAVDVGPTKTGKLLARKRPDLLPVIDDVVTTHIECAGDTYWMTFRAVLHDHALRRRVAMIRPGAPVLRNLDTMMWMHWSESERARAVKSRYPCQCDAA